MNRARCLTKKNKLLFRANHICPEATKWIELDASLPGDCEITVIYFLQRKRRTMVIYTPRDALPAVLADVIIIIYISSVVMSRPSFHIGLVHSMTMRRVHWDKCYFRPC